MARSQVAAKTVIFQCEYFAKDEFCTYCISSRTCMTKTSVTSPTRSMKPGKMGAYSVGGEECVCVCMCAHCRETPKCLFYQRTKHGLGSVVAPAPFPSPSSPHLLPLPRRPPPLFSLLTFDPVFQRYNVALQWLVQRGYEYARVRKE